MGNRSGYTSSGKSGYAKADKFTSTVTPHGWLSKITVDEGSGITHAFSRRGENETIDIWWQPGGGIIGSQPPIYTLAGERIKLKNVSACVSVANSPPDTRRLARTTRKRARRTTGVGIGLPGAANRGSPGLPEFSASFATTLPFDGDSSDAEVKVALAGRTIEWVNSQSGSLQAATISKINKIVRNDHDYIDFIDTTGRSESNGFHAVYLDRIVSVA